MGYISACRLLAVTLRSLQLGILTWWALFGLAEPCGKSEIGSRSCDGDSTVVTASGKKAKEQVVEDSRDIFPDNHSKAKLLSFTWQQKRPTPSNKEYNSTQK